MKIKEHIVYRNKEINRSNLYWLLMFCRKKVLHMSLFVCLGGVARCVRERGIERKRERERESKAMWCLHSISTFDVYSRLSVFEISDAASASALWSRYRWRDGFGLWEIERAREGR